MTKDKLNNFKEDILEKLREYIYIILPLLSLSAFFLLKKRLFNNVTDELNYFNNVVSLSGVLAGFMLSTFATFMNLPNNRFMVVLESTGYLNLIYNVIGLGVFFFFISMLLGLFNSFINITTIFFFMGVSEAIGMLYYFYNILKYSKKSK